jgi:protein-tyrosine phosphatase
MEQTIEYRRLLDVEGAYNVRDLGGYATSDGGMTRWGVYLRADNMNAISEAGQASLLRYGIKRIIDLRQSSARADTPNVFEDSVNPEYLHINVIGDEEPPGWAEATATLSGAENVFNTYKLMLDHRQDRFAEVMVRLSEPDFQPSIYHCQAGTDRTGIVSAFILSLAGVPRATIVEDYALSGPHLRKRILAEAAASDASPEELDEIRRSDLHPPAGAMDLTLDYLGEKYGGVAGYLDRIGVTGDQMKSICDAMLE